MRIDGNLGSLGRIVFVGGAFADFPVGVLDFNPDEFGGGPVWTAVFCGFEVAGVAFGFVDLACAVCCWRGLGHGGGYVGYSVDSFGVVHHELFVEPMAVVLSTFIRMAQSSNVEGY